MKQASTTLLVLALMSPATGWGQIASGRVHVPLVFTHVTVIDATGAAPRADVSVVVNNGRIAAIGRSLNRPAGAHVVNATGKFLIPGLWDMHTHLREEESVEAYLKLFIANGVTGVRFMDGNPAYRSWRADVEKGTLLGPHMVLASRFIDGPRPVHPDESIAVSNEDEARRAVLTARNDGADFLKVYSLVPHSAYLALAQEARERGIVFAGHVPREVTVVEVSDAGQKSIEHLSGIAFECSRRAAKYREDLAQLQAELARVGAPGHYLLLLRRMEGQYLGDYDENKCAALFARLKKNETWQVPTLAVAWDGARLGDPKFVDPLAKYLPPQTRQANPRNTAGYRNFTTADYAIMEAILVRQLQIVGAMQRAGLHIMAGTDISPVGFSLHDELALLVSAGLTPMEALQSATRNPASYLGLLDSLGTVEEGKIADLVLLDENPLADIRNSRKVNTVVVRGEMIPRTNLHRMLNEAANMRP
jgi:imidazolonepropionase-like amidohydrolase